MYLKRARRNDEDRLFGRTCRPVHASKFWIQAMHRYQTACRTHAYLNFIVKPSSKCKAEYACSTSQVYSLCANNVADHTPCDTIGCFNARYRQNKKLGRFKRSSNTLHYPVQGRHGSARACQYRSRASYLSAHHKYPTCDIVQEGAPLTTDDSSHLASGGTLPLDTRLAALIPNRGHRSVRSMSASLAQVSRNNQAQTRAQYKKQFASCS